MREQLPRTARLPGEWVHKTNLARSIDMAWPPHTLTGVFVAFKEYVGISCWSDRSIHTTRALDRLTHPLPARIA